MDLIVDPGEDGGEHVRFEVVGVQQVVLKEAAALIGLAPFVRIANALASRREPSIFTPHWTSAVISFRVKRGPTEHVPGLYAEDRGVHDGTQEMEASAVPAIELTPRNFEMRG